MITNFQIFENISTVEMKNPTVEDMMKNPETIELINATGFSKKFIEKYISNPKRYKENTYYFDRIVANPPFSGNQDIDHIKMMYDHLREGGRLVSMASKHWVTSTNKKETEFRNWLKEVGAETEDVPAGTFKESGTNIETVIVIINK